MVDDAETPPNDAPESAGLVPSGLPSRGAYVLAFLSVVVAGVLGGVIGYGLADLSGLSSRTVEGGGTEVVEESSTFFNVVGMIVGAAVGAVGVGVVAVLVLRAMAEWQRGGKRAR